MAGTSQEQSVSEMFAAHVPGGIMKLQELVDLFATIDPNFPGGAVKLLCADLGKQDGDNISVSSFLAEVFDDVKSTPPAKTMIQLSSLMSSDEGQSELKALFDSLDKDANGRVSLKEWGQSAAKNKDLVAKYFGGSGGQQIRGLFTWIDADKSKDLTWEEFVKASGELDSVLKVADVMGTEEGHSELKGLFDSLDKDASGAVSSKEMCNGFAANKELMSKYFGVSGMADISSFFKRIDVNGDKQLTWQEFVYAAAKFR